ncbi:glycosyltransferase family 61 protein [Pontibacter sp. BT310]|uniref:Glycosyltransferase family 61 protein n=1 Tax=Pontibacter populi TaxID=890055 RepID=A0ABS6XEX1_9BACT|nr:MULTISPECIES: glycosyltransferase family 61 protein [Pontibacter]MBJ6119685.1 glycosyltransferase family 61 protein [Pontibacter sp. BT310]MBR0572114.1 glycosyltransferase family 61 protein [Microvirga sp. STS03]MBW3366538.1 glycosyltransferase family 61 protein [Pontibacter populi]
MIKKFLFKLLHSAGYYFRYTSVLHHPSKQVFAPTQVLFFNEEERSFLEQSAASFNYSLDYSLGYRQKEQYLVKLDHAVILGNSGAVVQEGKVVVESVFDVSRLAKSPAFKTPALLFPSYKKGLYTSVLHFPWAENNNYHWYFDCLPRLYNVLQTIAEPIKVIMRRDLPKYQHETLQFLLQAHPNVQLVYIGKHEKWEIEEFLLPSFVSNAQSGYLPLPVSNWLRSKIWEGYKVEKSGQKRRIYISRAKAKTRQLLNEEQLLPLLASYGFEVIKAEELSYQQQVQLFYNTEAVIAPHGAGLTNLLFAEHCKVLEFHPANLVKTHYFLLCKGLGFDYSAIVGSVGNASENYSIELQRVEEWLSRL